MQVYFIRHAQSENNATWDSNNGTKYRVADPKLTEIGIQQAILTAKFLAETHPKRETYWVDPQNVCGFGITQMYCSLMERAVQTGTIISEKLGVPLEGRLDLHEVGGIYLKELVGEKEQICILHGHNKDYLRRNYENLILPEGIKARGWWRGGMETAEEKVPRAKQVIDFLLQKHGGTDDRISVITHGGAYKQIFRVLFKVAPETPFTVLINNCSITRLDFNENGVTLMYQNRVDFLSPNLIT
ncbi:MAG: histidine phosphatase family protein [Anaerolineaceae bacterium]|nr:histidine phosphatase family protein [Anaerolineaceae bacterium]